MSARYEPFKRELIVRWVPNPLKDSAATFLWGPRQTGKTTLLREQLPDALFYDLLDSDLNADLTVRPSRQHLGVEFGYADALANLASVVDIEWDLEERIEP